MCVWGFGGYVSSAVSVIASSSPVFFANSVGSITWRSASSGEAAETDRCRSTPLGLALPGLERLASHSCHCPARDGHCSASQGLPAVLDTENSARRTRAAAGLEGDPESDPQDEQGESALGSTAHPRRIPEARNRRRRDKCRQVHDAPSKTAGCKSGSHPHPTASLVG